MNKIITPLKIVSPRNKRFDSLRDMDFFTLDINGRSYSPQNLQDTIGYEVDSFNQTLGSIYESKKFKVRTASNFVKTTRNWKNLPYQRIKKVQNAINYEKQIQKLSHSQRQAEKSPRILPQFESIAQGSVSPKTTQKLIRQRDQFDIRKKVQTMRLKQIQQIIKNSRQQSKQKRNIIRFERKLFSLQASEFILLNGQRDNESVDTSDRVKQQRENLFRVTKSNIYSQMVKNRKKLAQKRQYRKKSVDHSLLGRINYLQQNNHQINFVLRNSFDKSKNL